MDQAQMDEIIEKIQTGEATDAEQIELLQELSFSYDVLKKYLEAIKIELLKAQIS